MYLKINVLKRILSSGGFLSASIPGSAAATRLKSCKYTNMFNITQQNCQIIKPCTCFTLYPAFALVSMNITFNSRAFLSPSSVETYGHK